MGSGDPRAVHTESDFERLVWERSGLAVRLHWSAWRRMKHDEHPVGTAGFTSWVLRCGEAHTADRLRTAVGGLHEPGSSPHHLGTGLAMERGIQGDWER